MPLQSPFCLSVLKTVDSVGSSFYKKEAIHTNSLSIQ